jgi:excisionase family DNA binding protein
MQEIYKEFLSIEEVAEYLHVYKDTVYRYLKDINKPLPSIKISRKKILVKKVDLDNWLEEQKN